jgi:hypothetical protein
MLSFLIGALLSYVYTMGFYAPLESKLPSRPTVIIEDVKFSEQDTSFFNVTVLNPSYSPETANITRIVVRTTDDNRVHRIRDTWPTLPRLLKPGSSQTFICNWNWANYTGIRLPYTDAPIEIFVFLKDNTGSVFETRRPYVSLMISKIEFNSTISVNHFNLTIENSRSSETYVNISSITVNVANIAAEMVTPNLPYGLPPGTNSTFKVSWNWTNYQGETITVGAHTLQGYMHQLTIRLPPPVNLTITDISFNISNTTHFNITILNAKTSPTHVDISRIILFVDNETIKLTEWTATPSPTLKPDVPTLLICKWEWTNYRNKNLLVKVLTWQGFTASRSTTIP